MTLLLPLLLACTSAGVDDSGAQDSGAHDGGAHDGGTVDGGASDGGVEDGGAVTDGGTTEDGGGTEDGGSTTEAPGVSGVSLAVHDDVATMLVASWAVDRPIDASWLSYQFGSTTMETPVRSLDTGGASQVLLGITADTDVSVTLFLEVDGETFETDLGTQTTGSLPDDLVVPELIVHDPINASPQEFALLSVDVGSYNFYGPCYTVIINRQGQVVWYYETSHSRLNMFTRVSRLGGHITIDGTVYYVYDGSEASIVRTTLDMEQFEEIEIPGMGFTYDELDDGSFVFDYGETGYEYHLDRLSPDGDRETIWSCYPWMSEYTTQYWGCAVNTVLWSPERNSVLWSMFETSTITEIDLDTGEQLWWAGQTPDSYDIVPASSMLELQHYANWTIDGTILTTTHVTSGLHKQVIREFELDEDAGTLTELWSYTPSAGHYGDYEGDVTRLENGNTVIGYGDGGVIQEVTDDGDVVWELDWDGNLTGHLTFLDDLYELNQGW